MGGGADKAQGGWKQARQSRRSGKGVSEEADGAAAAGSPMGPSPVALCQAPVPQDQKDVNQGQVWADGAGRAVVHPHITTGLEEEQEDCIHTHAHTLYLCICIYDNTYTYMHNL